MMQYSASLIITLDKHSNPIATIEHVFKQSSKDFEVIIVDSIGRSSWAKTIRSYQKKQHRLHYYIINKPQRAAAWNYGIKKAKANIIVIMGDDFLASKHFIEKHLDAHKKHPGNKSVVIGPAIFSQKDRISKYMRWLENSGNLFGVSFTKLKTMPKDFFWGANVSMKKELLLDAGGFDEAFPYHAWDDYELGIRLNKLGAKIFYEPKAMAIHDHKVTLRARIKAMRNAGESAVIFERKYPGMWPWQEKASVSNPKYFKKSSNHLLLYVLTNNDEHLGSYFQTMEGWAFAAGYKRALKNSKVNQ